LKKLKTVFFVITFLTVNMYCLFWTADNGNETYSNPCMLLSLKTNRYVGLTPGTGEPYAADRPGTLPNRKEGTVFIWEAINSN
jgi:hypothetical protein